MIIDQKHPDNTWDILKTALHEKKKISFVINGGHHKGQIMELLQIDIGNFYYMFDDQACLFRTPSNRKTKTRMSFQSASWFIDEDVPTMDLFDFMNNEINIGNFVYYSNTTKTVFGEVVALSYNFIEIKPIKSSGSLENFYAEPKKCMLVNREDAIIHILKTKEIAT